VSALAGLRAGFEKNKKPLAIFGAVSVAGLAVVARRRSAMGTATSTASTSTSSTTPAAAAKYGATTQQAYDSTGSDVYNALQPQIEQLQQLARQIPVAGATGTPAATPTSFARKPGTQAVYGVLPDGTRQWETASQWAGLGAPGFLDVQATDPLWSAPVVGVDAPAQYR
jgi:hypothetical protein